MTGTIGAAKGERTEARLAYRSGYYSRWPLVPCSANHLGFNWQRDSHNYRERQNMPRRASAPCR
jgi:hypothetical protein